jgi:hypothetical protein
MFQEETYEYVIEAPIVIWQSKDITNLQSDIRKTLQRYSLTCFFDGLPGYVDGCEVSIGAVAGQNHRLGANTTAGFQDSASRREGRGRMQKFRKRIRLIF